MKKNFLVGYFFILTSFSVENSSKIFKTTYFDKIEIIGKYEDNLPDYVVDLKCKMDGQLIYTAGPNEEFEFQNRIWEAAKEIGENSFQLLLELNDRPDKNKIILLTVKDKKLVDKKIIPTFDTCIYRPDKTKEFSGQLEYPEAMDNIHQTQYIPTLFYVDKPTGIVLDSAKTMVFNKSKWGKFYGFKPNFKLILPKKN